MIPSQLGVEYAWRTRSNPFENVWEEVRAKLVGNPGFEAKTLFEDLQRRYPGQFLEGGQIRSLQRRVKACGMWKKSGMPKAWSISFQGSEGRQDTVSNTTT